MAPSAAIECSAHSERNATLSRSQSRKARAWDLCTQALPVPRAGQQAPLLTHGSITFKPEVMAASMPQALLLKLSFTDAAALKGPMAGRSRLEFSQLLVYAFRIESRYGSGGGYCKILLNLCAVHRLASGQTLAATYAGWTSLKSASVILLNLHHIPLSLTNSTKPKQHCACYDETSNARASDLSCFLWPCLYAWLLDTIKKG